MIRATFPLALAPPLRIVSALVILIFFTFYVSSGMVAAGKFFESSFGWEYLHGMLLVAVVTLAYTLFGGLLGATLTDVAQGLVMFAALVAVPIVAEFEQMEAEQMEAEQMEAELAGLTKGDGPDPLTTAPCPRPRVGARESRYARSSLRRH